MNTQAKHTPGPWMIFAHYNGAYSIRAGTETLAEVHDLGRDRVKEQKGNVKVMAAAPAMYDALKAAADYIPVTSPEGRLIAKAIALAEGK